MKIGQALKVMRMELSMTQDEMCIGIVSRSFYAKVEAGKHEISAEKLARILLMHEIDISRFYQLIREDYITESQRKAEYLTGKMNIAVSMNDLDSLEECCSAIMKLGGYKILKLRAIVTLAYFRKSLTDISSEIKKEIYINFDESEKWITRPELIRLLANTMPLWQQENLDFLIGRLLAYLKRKPKISSLMLERYLRLLSNYLVTCYDRSKENKLLKFNHIDDVISYFEELPPNFNLMIYKFDAKFSKALIQHNEDELERIKKDLLYYGFGEVTKSWTK